MDLRRMEASGCVGEQPQVIPEAIVSIRTPETDVDLYTPIAQQVGAQAAVPVVVNT